MAAELGLSFYTGWHTNITSVGGSCLQFIGGAGVMRVRRLLRTSWRCGTKPALGKLKTGPQMWASRWSTQGAVAQAQDTVPIVEFFRLAAEINPTT